MHVFFLHSIHALTSIRHVYVPSQYEEVSKNQSWAITQSLFGWNESHPRKDFNRVYVNEKDPADVSGKYIDNSK